jgi:hypothetical protein
MFCLILVLINYCCSFEEQKQKLEHVNQIQLADTEVSNKKSIKQKSRHIDFLPVTNDFLKKAQQLGDFSTDKEVSAIKEVESTPMLETIIEKSEVSAIKNSESIDIKNIDTPEKLLNSITEGKVTLDTFIINKFIASLNNTNSSLNIYQLCQFAKLQVPDDLLIELAKKTTLTLELNFENEKLCPIPKEATKIIVSKLLDSNITLTQFVNFNNFIKKQDYSDPSLISQLANKVLCNNFANLSDYSLKLYELPDEALKIIVSNLPMPVNNSEGMWAIYKILLGDAQGNKYSKTIINLLINKITEISFCDLDPVWLSCQDTKEKITTEEMEILVRKIKFSANAEWEKQYVKDGLLRSGYSIQVFNNNPKKHKFFNFK